MQKYDMIQRQLPLVNRFHRMLLQRLFVLIFLMITTTQSFLSYQCPYRRIVFGKDANTRIRTTVNGMNHIIVNNKLHQNSIVMILAAESAKSSYGPDNFGDIMGGCETSVSLEGSFLPMERVILTANGNLQRIMSAYYGAPVTVHVKKTNKINSNTFDREVDLLVENKIFCRVVGKIELYDQTCLEVIASGKVGVGQLFRYLGVLPAFHLMAAGRNITTGELWRDYELSCPQLKCRFVEIFDKNIWTLTQLR